MPSRDTFSKWKARCWQGVYVGPSICHASNISLIYNPTTTHVTSQFHVIHNEGFTSLMHLSNEMRDAVMRKLYGKAK
jgi:hypothetical protein